MKRLYLNGHIHTMTGEEDVFSVMAVENGRISYVGNEVPQGYDEVIDLGGKHVFPAMTDSHIHLLYSLVLAAGSFQVCDISPDGVKPSELSEVGERIRLYCEKNPKRKIITGNGYIASAIAEKRLPNRYELDEWSGGRAVIIYNIDGHSSAMSTKLMELLSLDTAEHDGIFSGEAHEFIQGRVTNLIASSVTPGLLAKGIANFSNTCTEYGIARVCAMDGNEDLERDILTSLLVFIAKRMSIGVRLFPQYMRLERAARLSKHMLKKRVGGCGAWELDGSVGSQSAAFDEPYQSGKQGHLYYGDEHIDAKVHAALSKGFMLSSHAIGETAIGQIVSAYEKAHELIPQSGAMPRIDHFEFPSKKTVESIKKLRLAITVQPGFSWVDKRYLKSYEQFLSEDVIGRQLPLRELYEAGVCICGSSDSPVQSVSPYEQMLGMVDFYLSEQSLSNYAALLSYTANPAKMLGEDSEFGTLELGKSADFFICNTDLVNCSAAELASAKAEKLYVRGKEYKKKKGSMAELVKLIFTRPHKI